MPKAKRYGVSISSRGWNKKGLDAGSPLTKPSRVLTVKVIIYDGRRTQVRYITVDKLPVGRKKLYDVSAYASLYGKLPKDRRHYASRKSFNLISKAENQVIDYVKYYGGIAAWNFRVGVVRKR